MAEKRSLRKEFTKGLISENPTMRLVLGTCPTLAVTTSIVNALGMGVSAMLVLVCSNVVISALRKIIPSKVRIPAYIVVIASFVTIVQMIVKAFVPALDESLGVFLPLIVVNCIILGRAEAFAGKNPVLASAVDGLGMGIGFTFALCCMGAIREIIGAGTIFSGAKSLLSLFSETTFDGITLIGEGGFIESISPMTIFILAPGGFFTFGILMACANKLAERKGKPKAELGGCSACPMAKNCALLNKGEACEKKEEAEA